MTDTWCSKNPHAVYEIPLHDLEVGVWSAVNASNVTVHDLRRNKCQQSINTDAVLQGNNRREKNSYSTQDSAISRVMTALEVVFDEQLITRGFWLPRSPDLRNDTCYLGDTTQQNHQKIHICKNWATIQREVADFKTSSTGCQETFSEGLRTNQKRLAISIKQGKLNCRGNKD